MSEKLDVQVTGKSIYQVAHEIAVSILTAEQQGPPTKAGRKAYLRAVYEAMEVLSRNDTPTK